MAYDRPADKIGKKVDPAPCWTHHLLVFHRSAQQKPAARTLGAIALASNPMPIAGPHKPRSTLILARNRVGYRAPFLDRTQRSLPYYIEYYTIRQSTCAHLQHWVTRQLREGPYARERLRTVSGVLLIYIFITPSLRPHLDKLYP